MARTEVRKECPSCGLGVPLDAKVCEFCGWDFEEEDEWISQIEQLEQELMSEKQKSDSGKVDRMIKSTLRSPVREKPPEKPAETKKPVAVTIKKKVPSKAEGAEEPIGERPEEPESITIRAPRAEPSAKSAISVRVGASREEIPPPPDELEVKKEPAPVAPKPILGSGKKVRRVVKGKRPMPPGGVARPVAQTCSTAVKAAPAKPVAQSVSKTPSTTQSKPAAAKPVPAPAPPAKTAPAQTPQAKPQQEKKGLFGGLGKLFSVETKEKESKPEPKKQPDEKQVPQKGALPADEQKPTPEEEKSIKTVRVFICPLCNAEVEETEKACPKCGAEFE